MASRLSAEQLLERVAERDAEAMGELFDRYAPSLIAAAERMAGDREKAEEVVEEAFVKLANEARALARERASAAVALVFIVRARAYDRQRAAGKARAAGLPNPDRKNAAWLPRPEQAARVEEKLELLARVLAQLPKSQREIAEMAALEGSTDEEIAARLGEPLAKVRATLVAAMRFVRHRIEAVTRTWAVNI